MGTDAGVQSDGGSTSSDGGTTTGTDAGTGKADAGTPPATPSNLAALPGNGLMTLTWSASPGATSYRLYWAAASTVSKATGTVLLSVSSPFIHQGLTNSTQYAYVVTALNASGESTESAVVTGTPSASSSTQPPFIAVTRPDLDQTGVRLDTQVVIRATKLLDGTTATSGTIQLVSDAGVVATTVTAAGDTSPSRRTRRSARERPTW